MQSRPKRGKSAKTPFVQITNTMFEPQSINIKLKREKREKTPAPVEPKPPKVNLNQFAKRLGEIIKLERQLQVERERTPKYSPEQVFGLFA